MKSLREFHREVRGLALMVLVYLLPAFQALLPVDDPDIWWHLRTGQWIIEHGQVPTVDPFSAGGEAKAWVAYSWLFEVLVYGIFEAFGLLGIVFFTVAMSLLIALAFHLLVRRANLPFLAEIGLLILALGGMKSLYTPRPWLFSMLFFAIEINLLLYARRHATYLPLIFLPPIFALWANLHIQFIYGLAVLGIFVAERSIEQLWPKMRSNHDPQSSLAMVYLLAVACGLASLLTPYHFRLALPLLDYASQTGAFRNISELHPLFFRVLNDWFVLALALGAAFALGREQRLRVFPLLLMAMAALLSFRAQRDVWVMATAATALICESYHRSSAKPQILSAPKIALTAIGILASLGFMASYRGIAESHLTRVVAQRFPTKAVDFVRQHRYPGPLFNHLDWGGYLIWSLPHPAVTMDGRTNLYGDERIDRSLATWSGYSGWDSNPDLVQARLIIAEAGRPLTALLRKDSRFRIVYEDPVAVVFIKPS